MVISLPIGYLFSTLLLPWQNNVYIYDELASLHKLLSSTLSKLHLLSVAHVSIVSYSIFPSSGTPLVRAWQPLISLLVTVLDTMELDYEQLISILILILRILITAFTLASNLWGDSPSRLVPFILSRATKIGHADLIWHSHTSPI